jgi:DNA-binding transcriptional ArsR family regulator
MSSSELNEMLAFFKALSDESRLKIVGALSSGEQSVDVLAGLLGLRAPTVSHHLARLKEISLVSMRSEGNTHFYKLNVQALHTLSKQLLAPEAIASIGNVVSADAWDRKVLRDFLVGETLKEIPASRKKRVVILHWLAGHFEPGKRYAEKQVNAIIGKHHSDFTTLRRELIGARLLNRENGVYWRPI